MQELYLRYNKSYVLWIKNHAGEWRFPGTKSANHDVRIHSCVRCHTLVQRPLKRIECYKRAIKRIENIMISVGVNEWVIQAGLKEEDRGGACQAPVPGRPGRDSFELRIYCLTHKFLWLLGGRWWYLSAYLYLFFFPNCVTSFEKALNHLKNLWSPTKIILPRKAGKNHPALNQIQGLFNP